MKYVEFDAKKPLYNEPLYWYLRARRTLLPPSDAAWTTTCALQEELYREDTDE